MSYCSKYICTYNLAIGILTHIRSYTERLDLLMHPMVGSLLHRKWIKFGQPGYIVNLLTYILFLTFLTTFALIVKNPTSQSCELHNNVYFHSVGALL